MLCSLLSTTLSLSSREITYVATYIPTLSRERASSGREAHPASKVTVRAIRTFDFTVTLLRDSR